MLKPFNKLLTSLLIVIFISASSLANEADYSKYSATEMVNLFSRQLLSNIDRWDLLRKEDSKTFIAELQDWGKPWFDHTRVAAGVMGKTYYLKATKAQRIEFSEILFNSLINNYAQGLFLVEVTDVSVVSDKAGKNPKFHTVIQKVASGDKDAEIIYQLYRKNDKDYWKVINLFANGIDFKKTLNGSFQRLAQRHDGDIAQVITSWDR